MLTKREYKIGDLAESKRRVEHIYGQSTDVIVFRNDIGIVECETSNDEITDVQLAAMKRYQQLRARLEACLPSSRHDKYTEALARALFLAVSEDSIHGATACFDHVAGELDQESINRARLPYLVYSSAVASFILAVSLLSLSLMTDMQYASYFIAGAAGAVGAWTSVLQRASRLKLGQFENPAAILFQGVTRIVLGTLFGIIALLAIKAGILLPSAAGTPSATALVGVLAGFSERFVPELLQSLEERLAKTDERPPTSK